MKKGIMLTMAALMLSAQGVQAAPFAPVNARVVTFGNVSLVSGRESIVALVIEAKGLFEGYCMALGFDPARIQLVSIEPIAGTSSFQGIMASNNDAIQSEKHIPYIQQAIADNDIKGLKTALVSGVSAQKYSGTVPVAALVIKGLVPGTTVIDVRLLPSGGLVVLDDANNGLEVPGSAHKISVTVVAQ